jgi:hypothetical protein
MKLKNKKSTNVILNDSPFFGEKAPFSGEKERYVKEGNFCLSKLFRDATQIHGENG